MDYLINPNDTAVIVRLSGSTPGSKSAPTDAAQTPSKLSPEAQPPPAQPDARPPNEAPGGRRLLMVV